MIPGLAWAVFRFLAPARSPFASAVTYHECRRCGTNLASEDDECPYCDSAGVVRYELD